jgi:hypothetical protein
VIVDGRIYFILLNRFVSFFLFLLLVSVVKIVLLMLYSKYG